MYINVKYITYTHIYMQKSISFNDKPECLSCLLRFLLSSGPLLGSLNLNQSVFWSRSDSARRRRYIEEAELFNIEVNELFKTEFDGLFEIEVSELLFM